jgi:hypothetical protein
MLGEEKWMSVTRGRVVFFYSPLLVSESVVLMTMGQRPWGLTK